jgi:hypothetical protein
MALQPLIGGTARKIAAGLGAVPRLGKGAETGFFAPGGEGMRGRARRPVPGVRGAGGALAKGAGVGLAAAGTGAGIMLAAEGISKLATAMKDLSPEQAEALTKIGMTLAITFPAAAIGMALAGKAAQGGALGIAIITAAVIGLGFAVRIATVGIGKMAESIAKARTAKSNALKDTAVQISSSKEDFKEVQRAINAISRADLSNLKPLRKLGKLFEGGPLQVEFADKEVAVVSNVTLNIDGYQFVQQLGIPQKVAIQQGYMRTGKEAGR